MKSKQEKILRDLEVINNQLDIAYNEGLDFNELVEGITNELGISKEVLKYRFDKLGYNWIDVKHQVNENSIQEYYKTLDKYIKPFPETFAEDVYNLLGKDKITKRYCRERGIKSNKYRYKLIDNDGNVQYVSKSNHPLFGVWNMKKAMTGHGNHGYIQEHHKKYYLDKGVDMWKPWVDSFDKFYDDLMELGWYRGCHISRKGDVGNYEPNNIECLTPTENIKAAHPTTPLKITNLDTGEEYYFESQNEAATELSLNQGCVSLKIRGIANCYNDYEIELV